VRCCRKYGQNILDNEPTISAKRPNFFRTKTIEPQITTKNRKRRYWILSAAISAGSQDTTTSAATPVLA